MSAVLEPELGAPARRAEASAVPTLYTHVGERLAGLTSLLGLADQRERIAEAYALLCRQALDLPLARRPLQASHMNADGTPFQFALALGAGRPALQFLTETAPPGVFGAERLATARQAVRDLAELIGAGQAFAAVSPWIEALASQEDSALLADDAGAIWVGAAFSAGGEARMKIYVNAKHGSAASRWDRLDAFAGRFGVSPDWRAAGPAIDRLAPLGVSLVIGRDAAPTGRVYLAGYGQPLSDHLAFAERFGGAGFRSHLHRAARTWLEGDCTCPTRSAVASVGLRAGGLAEAKVELCAHCAFDDDVQATTRCARWLRQIDIDPALYLQTVALLSDDAPSRCEAALHAYVGIASGRGSPGATFYFNPAAGAA